jgi:hypothetical protein
MDNPRNPPCLGGHWTTKLIPIASVLILYLLLSREVDEMRSSPKSSFLAALTASLAQHGKAADASGGSLSWYAPNTTSINNLTQVIGGSGVYGYIYNSSETPSADYGLYNWCNMPHVRATEYKKPSSEYKLQYVEVVSASTFELMKQNLTIL